MLDFEGRCRFFVEEIDFSKKGHFFLLQKRTTLQGMDTYPTKREKENHLFKVPW